MGSLPSLLPIRGGHSESYCLNRRAPGTRMQHFMLIGQWSNHKPQTPQLSHISRIFVALEIAYSSSPLKHCPCLNEPHHPENSYGNYLSQPSLKHISHHTFPTSPKKHGQQRHCRASGGIGIHMRGHVRIYMVVVSSTLQKRCQGRYENNGS